MGSFLLMGKQSVGGFRPTYHPKTPGFSIGGRPRRFGGKRVWSARWHCSCRWLVIEVEVLT
jgi:hypothetical protein